MVENWRKCAARNGYWYRWTKKLARKLTFEIKILKYEKQTILKNVDLYFQKGKELESELERVETEKEEEIEHWGNMLNTLEEENKRLVEKTQEVKDENEQIVKKLLNAVDENERLVGKIEDIEDENIQLVGKIQDLEDENIQLDKSFQEVESENIQLIAKGQDIKDMNTQLVRKIQEVKDKFKYLERLVNKATFHISKAPSDPAIKAISIKEPIDHKTEISRLENMIKEVNNKKKKEI